MNRIRIALASLLLLGLTVVCYAQSTGQSQTSAQQAPTLNQEEPKHPEASPPPQPTETAPQQPEAAPPRNPEEKPPSQKEEKPAKEEQPKAGHEEHGKTADHAHAHPAGKGVHIPDPKFKTNFGRQHTFTVKRVVTTTTIVPNQTQFVSGGFTFVFLDPWPTAWLFTDDCYIDFIGDEYVLVDVLHPGVTVALLVIG